MTKIERELENKGYYHYKSYNVPTEAKENAKKLREQGYRARVVTATSCAIGYHSYDVYYKEK